MTDQNTQHSGVFPLGKIIFLAVILTAGVIFGIKYLVGGPDATREYDSSPDAFKTEPRENAPPGYNPASRPEPAPGGDSLGMFTKTNSGYSKEDEEAGTEQALEAAQAAKAAETRAAEAAKKSAAANTAKPATVIPRLQPAKGFKLSETGKTARPPQGAGTPDMAAILERAKKGAAQKTGE
ncbi:MAG: hypothetical protein A2234_11040 [Elusimicrobia bacterium RIFOXYA2_FULL_58_8]|nr:MAG: hypothetical protein A2285_10380 [Elusimicrobia bacterium RIFOXYA12_FULL_57_11]OGS14553.1 MAG: hypothetical protein A2234_11040 [Elusimicrobia bacterium RIFOXYA2_FULL_58_8]